MWGVGLGDSVAPLQDAPVLGVQDGHVERMAVKGENGEGGLVGVVGFHGSEAPRGRGGAPPTRPGPPSSGTRSQPAVRGLELRV